MVHSIAEFLNGIDWNSPHVVILTILLLVLAIMRKWFLLAMTVLVVTLARGLYFLQASRGQMPDNGLTLATLVYVAGGVIVISFAAVDFFVKQ